MTIREVYESVLIELNKVLAPALLLDDFVYIFNKAIQLYFNKKYTLFEMNQLLTDDLRALTKTATLLKKSDGRYYLPEDYVHILNCICKFKGPESKCSKEEYFEQGANKLDTNQWSQVINNYYMKPSIKRPYYYIINVDDPMQTSKEFNENKDDGIGYVIDTKAKKIDVRKEGRRYGNLYLPIVEIKCGDGLSKLKDVKIDYLRAPKYIDLTTDELDEIEDNTSHLEFPDYVIYEIIKEIVTICMENAKDQRLLTYIPVNTSILNLTTLKL